MSSFTKWLDWSPATPDAVLSPSGRRWANYSPASSVRKLNLAVLLPVFTIPHVLIQIYPYIVGQFNFSAGQPFSLVNGPYISSLLHDTHNFLLCIRYRVGTTVYRYRINGIQNDPYMNYNVFIPPYEGQKIDGNFCIEVWCRAIADVPPFFFEDVINPAAVGFLSSIEYLPSMLLETDGYLYSASGLILYDTGSLSGVGAPLPLIMPAQFSPAQSWLSN